MQYFPKSEPLGINGLKKAFHFARLGAGCIHLRVANMTFVVQQYCLYYLWIRRFSLWEDLGISDNLGHEIRMCVFVCVLLFSVVQLNPDAIFGCCNVTPKPLLHYQLPEYRTSLKKSYVARKTKSPAFLAQHFGSQGWPMYHHSPTFAHFRQTTPD